MDEQQPAPSRNQKILIIEDEQFISELYVRTLGKAGYEVKVVLDGEEALKEAKSNQYDIILLDIMLPNLTGTEILRRLRDVKETPDLKAKIIITTNLELDPESRAAIEAQADGYIVKAEITPKELATFLEQLQLN
ncbi:MAG TPA: response regulator [Candidatus Saccharimonadales bacterium]|nr:response regulator [Candidatus Saccharimonadales bacterium]